LPEKESKEEVNPEFVTFDATGPIPVHESDPIIAFNSEVRSDVSDIDEYSPLQLRLFPCPKNDAEATKMSRMFS